MVSATGQPTQPREAPAVVLVVDDSAIDRALIVGLIQKHLGCEIRTAANGAEALQAMATEPPDLVLTDLQMPELDGLALVEAIRLNYPFVPTILMTAHGSEEVAFQALKVGAANYVNKRNLVPRLSETIRDVLAVSQRTRQHLRLNDCWCGTQFQFELENDATLIPALVSHLQEYQATVRRRDETELVRVGIALHEALRNAMHHGNLELDSSLRQQNSDAYYRLADDRRRQAPYRHRRVILRAEETKYESRYQIIDEGPGFDAGSFQYDPTAAMNLDKPSGRGLFLIRTFMDEVAFNDSGNQITMIHRRHSNAQPTREAKSCREAQLHSH